MLVNVNESVASMIAPANAKPNDSPNDPAAEFTPGGLADPLLGDRGQRVVVELRHQQAQARARDHQRDQRGTQPESARGTIGISTTSPTVSSANPTRMMLLGRRLPAFLPGEQRDARTC